MAGEFSEYKVKLRSITSRSLVVFDVTPDLQESRSVEYKSTNLLHTPGAIFSYGYTNSRDFSLSNVRLISRTSEEAYHNMRNLQILRSWTMPRFGENSATVTRDQYDARIYREDIGQHVPREPGTEDLTPEQRLTIYGGRELLGAPPEILYLYAYAKEIDSKKGAGSNRKTLTNIQHVPVVMTDLTITYPSDVDYIPAVVPNRSGGTTTLEPFPTIMTISMTLKETHSPREYSLFSLQDFKNGNLDNF